MGHVLQGDPSAHFSQVRSNYAFYGIIAVLPAYLAERWAAAGGSANSMAVYTYVLHATAFLCYLLTIVLTYRILHRTTGDRIVAVIGSWLLALYPLWLGYAFFNHKDLPTAFTVLFALYAAILVLQSGDNQKALRRAGWLLVLASILAAGLKIAALVLIIPAWAATLLHLARRREFAFVAKICAASVLGIYVITPVAWTDPFNFATQSLLLMSRHSWNGCTVTAGACVQPHSPAWSAWTYMSQLYLAQLPLFIAVGAVLGVLSAPFRNAAQMTIAASLLLPLILISARNSTIYDGLRQLLFTVPLIFVLAALFWHDVTRGARGHGAATIAVLLGAFFVWDNVRMFPYNYISYNLISRQMANSSNFETDFWGFSLREAAQLPVVRESTLPVVGNPSHLIAPYVQPPGRPFQGAETIRTLGTGNDAILVSYTRYTPVPAGCSDVQYVARQLPAGGRVLLLSFAARCKLS